MDPVVSSVLEAMMGADAPTTDRDYLFVDEDFSAWLQELRSPPPDR
jgi:hypothetical protein